MGVFTAPSAVDMGSVYSTIREVIWGCSNDNQMDILGAFPPSEQGCLRHIYTLSPWQGYPGCSHHQGGVMRAFTHYWGGAVRAHLPHHQGGSMQGAFTPPSAKDVWVFTPPSMLPTCSLSFTISPSGS